MHKKPLTAHNWICSIKLIVLEIKVAKIPKLTTLIAAAKTNWCSAMTKFQFCRWEEEDLYPPVSALQ